MQQDNQQAFLTSKQVRQRYGSVSHMWLVRRLADDAAFPRPLVIARRRFWKLEELEAWERGLAAKGTKRERAA